ncbi:MAG: hypothetical protein EXQ85_04940 [Alphaproteobacteria bacterium]|nr:hypothetical protein [Alphaproteobacteria bacterium]
MAIRRTALLALLVLVLPTGAAYAHPDLIGCFATEGPQGPIHLRVTQSSKGYAVSFADSPESEPLEPVISGDLSFAAEELQLERFPGVTVSYGLSNDDEIIVALSTELVWKQWPTRYALIAPITPLPLFKIACR